MNPSGSIVGAAPAMKGAWDAAEIWAMPLSSRHPEGSCRNSSLHQAAEGLAAEQAVLLFVNLFEDRALVPGGAL